MDQKELEVCKILNCIYYSKKLNDCTYGIGLCITDYIRRAVYRLIEEKDKEIERLKKELKDCQNSKKRKINIDYSVVDEFIDNLEEIK